MNTNQLPEQEPKGHDKAGAIKGLILHTISGQLTKVNHEIENTIKFGVDLTEEIYTTLKIMGLIESHSAQAGKEIVLTHEETERLKAMLLPYSEFDPFMESILTKLISIPTIQPAPEEQERRVLIHEPIDSSDWGRSNKSQPSPLPEDVENTVNNIIDLFKFHRYFDKPQLDAIRPLLRDELAKSRETDKRKVVYRLTELRNELFDSLPVGEVKPMELIQAIDGHLIAMDDFINSLNNLK